LTALGEYAHRLSSSDDKFVERLFQYVHKRYINVGDLKNSPDNAGVIAFSD